MNNIREELTNLNKWREIQPLHYRYVLSPGCCYEILVTTNPLGKDDLDRENADAVLFITGSWNLGLGFTREALYEGKINECLDSALNDYIENIESENFPDIQNIINSKLSSNDNKEEGPHIIKHVSDSCEAMYMED